MATILDFAVTLFLPTVVIFLFGLAYKILRFIFHAKFIVPKPEYRWREEFEKHGLLAFIIYFIKELIMVFLRPIIWLIRRGPHELIAGLGLLHLVGVIPILLLLSQHITIWLVYVPNAIRFAISGLWYFLSLQTFRCRRATMY